MESTRSQLADPRGPRTPVEKHWSNLLSRQRRRKCGSAPYQPTYCLPTYEATYANCKCPHQSSIPFKTLPMPLYLDRTRLAENWLTLTVTDTVLFKHDWLGPVFRFTFYIINVLTCDVSPYSHVYGFKQVNGSIVRSTFSWDYLLRTAASMANGHAAIVRVKTSALLWDFGRNKENFFKFYIYADILFLFMGNSWTQYTCKSLKCSWTGNPNVCRTTAIMAA
jgi:hypothetical protein